MKTTLKLLPLTIAFFSLSCVSVNVGSNSATAAKDVVFTPPESPFKKTKVPGVDEAWISTATENSISFLSDCEIKHDPSLDQIQTDYLGSMQSPKIIVNEDTTYNGREAKLVVAEGRVDGIMMRLKLLAFKKNGCSYSLLYSGLAKKLDLEDSLFQKFIEGFKAP